MNRGIKMTLTVLLLHYTGCVLSSIESFQSPSFVQPPEIWIKEGRYHLRLYEIHPDPVGFSVAHSERTGNQIQVWVSVRHSSGSDPNRLISLGIPIPADGSTPKFMWRDPDGSLHEMRIRLL